MDDERHVVGGDNRVAGKERRGAAGTERLDRAVLYRRVDEVEVRVGGDREFAPAKV